MSGRKQTKTLRHVGLRPDRDKFSRLERAFSELWRKENRRQPGLNYGFGILQDLLFVPYRVNGKLIPSFSGIYGPAMRPGFLVNQRDATIAATLIQWLGTNCGFSFLMQALAADGWRIVADKDRFQNLPANERYFTQETERKIEPIPDRVSLYKTVRQIKTYSGAWVAGYHVRYTRDWRGYPAALSPPERWYVDGLQSDKLMTAAGVAKAITSDYRRRVQSARLP